MTARARSSRQDWILIGALIGVVFVGGAVTGYFLARPSAPPSPPAVASQPAISPAQLQVLLDEGKYAEVLAEGKAAAGRSDVDPRTFRLLAVAHLLSSQPGQAASAAEQGLLGGLPAPEPAMAQAIKALALLQIPDAQPGAAKEAAEQAVVQTAKDPHAGLVAAVAYAAVLRDELDRLDGKSAIADQARRIRQSLEPIYAFNPVEPKPAWQARFWRHGLALLADSGILAGQAGDNSAEAHALSLLGRSAPTDAWNCRFRIPLRAQLAARNRQAVGKVDDHGRLALCILTGVLYESVGDWRYADAAYAVAMRACNRALLATQDWRGPESTTVYGGEIRTVAAEFYAYRDCLDRLAAYRGLRGGIEVVEGRAKMEQLLASSDHPLYRAVVRLRADRQAEPLAILQAENLPSIYCGPLADLLVNHLYPPQAEWEQARAQIVRDGAAELARLEQAGRSPAAGRSTAASAGVAGTDQPGSEPHDDLTAIASGVHAYAPATSGSSTPQANSNQAGLVVPLPDFDMLSYGASAAPAAGSRPAAAPAGRPADLARELLGADGPLPDADLEALLDQVLQGSFTADPAQAVEAFRQLSDKVANDPQISPEVRQMVKSLDDYLQMIEELTGSTLGHRHQPAPAQASPRRQQAR